MDRPQVTINRVRGIQQCAAPRPTTLNQEAHDEITSQVEAFLARGGVIQELPSNFASNPTYSFDKSRIIARG